jgi:putative membrane protein
MKLYKRQFVLGASCAFFVVSAIAAGNPDETLVKAAAQGGMAEVKLGQLAADKAQNPKVTQFGQKMVADHSKAGDELKSVAQQKMITLPGDIAPKDHALMTRLSGLSGAEFDKAYMSAMVKDHETDIADFQKEADNGRDPDFKTFAGKTLPTLQEHLRMAKEASSAVGAAQ